MDPYKFNSWIRILICLCSIGAYLLIALMLPLFVAVHNFETRFGIFFVSPYNDNKYISWYKFEGHICSSDKLHEETSKTKNYAKETRSILCGSINFLKHYFLIVFIITAINLLIVKGMLIYTHFREHPESFALKHVHFCNKLIMFGKTHYLHAGFYILMADFLSHFLIIIFVKRDKTILKCVCELELLPWEKKQKLHTHNADYNDTLISPAELTNYLHAMFQEEHITEDQLKNFFGTDNYEQIYYIIMNNVKTQKQMAYANAYP
ncbi:hypothetical protein PCYB_072390 [Plasmodium cynomolgi strain B]|uniref:Uncharacterized protein n=1 Tax=Plasmodium cynomolgi (strain B) TaxID=1120755 RepID=K6V995_PLACD|nr:hypothetical protein PCYB_072390 [Plasmodium cynomolgi strain B]GAB65737.1 hypothetical protein PCYB_072390 [Plasmodium cynomolgi strain B]